MVFSTPVKNSGRQTHTEVTHCSTQPTLSIPSSQNTPDKRKASIHKSLFAENEGETKKVEPYEAKEEPAKAVEENLTLRWYDEDRYIHFVSVSSDVVLRMKASYLYSSDSFMSYLRNYVKRMYMNAEMCAFPFVLPTSFYALCKEVMQISHELFSGALYYTGLLPFYCSEDSEDYVFGSQGTWRQNEDLITSGVGILQLDEDSLIKTFRKLEKKIITRHAYCRVFFFPVENEEKIIDVLTDEDYLGELICLIPGSYINRLRHKLDVFREGCDSHDDEDFVPAARYGLAIWMNDAYRVAHPPPQDVEECFTYWAVETFRDNEILDYDAIYRCFPPRTRGVALKEKRLQDIVKW